jgi:hypothetical protein
MDTDRCNRCRVDLYHSADLQLLRSVKLFSAMEVEQRIIRDWGMAIHNSNKDVFLVILFFGDTNDVGISFDSSN